MGTLLITFVMAILLASAGLPPALVIVFIIVILVAAVLPKGVFVKREHPMTPVANMTPAQYEEHVGYMMREWGFGNVRVMGGTGDFGADVLCTDTGGQKVCVQCKKYSKPVGVSAVQEVIGARGFYGCQRAIVATTTSFTPAARQLAEKNGVELVIIN